MESSSNINSSSVSDMLIGNYVCCSTSTSFSFLFCEAMGMVHTMWLGKCKPAGHLTPN